MKQLYDQSTMITTVDEKKKDGRIGAFGGTHAAHLHCRSARTPHRLVHPERDVGGRHDGQALHLKVCPARSLLHRYIETALIGADRYSTVQLCRGD